MKQPSPARVELTYSLLSAYNDRTDGEDGRAVTAEAVLAWVLGIRLADHLGDLNILLDDMDIGKPFPTEAP